MSRSVDLWSEVENGGQSSLENDEEHDLDDFLNGEIEHSRIIVSAITFGIFNGNFPIIPMSGDPVARDQRERFASEILNCRTGRDFLAILIECGEHGFLFLFCVRWSGFDAVSVGHVDEVGEHVLDDQTSCLDVVRFVQFTCGD